MNVMKSNKKEKMKQRLFTRNFTFLILGQVSSLIGNYSLRFVLSMYVLEQTGTASIFAGILAVSMIPTILLSPFGGILADRVNRRNIMVTLDAVSGMVVLIAGVLLPVWNGVAVVGGLLLILSVLGAFESPTVQACVPQMLSGDNIIRGNVAVNQIQAVTALVTPFLGSVFYTAFGILPVLYATAFCFFLTAILECFIRLDDRRQKEKMRIWMIVKGDFTESMRFLCKEETSVLKLLALAALVSMFVIGTVAIGFPYLVRATLGLSAEHYGASESAMGVAAILGSLMIGLLADKIQMRKIYLLMAIAGLFLILAGAAFLLPCGTFGIYLVLTAAFCGCQFAGSAFSIYVLSDIQRRTPEHLTGKVMAYVYTFSLCAQPLAQIFYGAAFDLCSERVYLVLIPSGVLVCLIAFVSSGVFTKLET